MPITSAARNLLNWPDVLNQPLTDESIGLRARALDDYLRPRVRIQIGAVIASVTALLLCVALAFSMPLHSPLPAYALCVAAVAMLPGVLLGVCLLPRQALRTYLASIPPENVAEMEWLIEQVPQAAGLKAAVEREPRGYVFAELKALREAYRANKAANASSMP
ncbi:hypothetical protein [Burkholderia cenocepacia]|uniref:hypothetical protein n=1 Tax=Burkholderia cenocepacia TaxID=95486 RepID=UPI00076188F3|nr:hypothetical protein [Burkholderia cenocepacia]KWU19026.1 hypothetical protein AS149_12320 [Burkholderia cenocepacia]